MSTNIKVMNELFRRRMQYYFIKPSIGNTYLRKIIISFKNQRLLKTYCNIFNALYYIISVCIPAFVRLVLYYKKFR